MITTGGIVSGGKGTSPIDGRLVPPSDLTVAAFAAAAISGARVSPDSIIPAFAIALLAFVGAAVVSGLLVSAGLFGRVAVGEEHRRYRVGWRDFVRPGRLPSLVLAMTVGALLFVGCSVLAQRSHRGLRLPAQLLTQSAFDLALVGDPAPMRSSTVVDGRIAGKHLEVRASGSVGQVLANLAAGRRLRVRGRLRSIEPPIRSWLRSRHIAGRLTVTAIERVEPPDQTPVLFRLANGIRARLLRSGDALPRSQRGLFAGFMLGDDREQTPEMIDDFRASGLSHLLVVSGQNVAFTLAVVEPLLRRLRRRARLVSTLVLLVVFATVTRFEPSVLRAVWMAGVVAAARCVGRPQKGLRVLALAVISLVVIDPLLSYSVGFALSLAATAGLALWSDPLGRRLPLPDRIRSIVAPTLAAQAGASVVMIPTFGSMPVVSLLANVVVVPIAAPLMGWGVAAGLPAGMLGSGASRVVHLPTTAVLGFVAWAARTAAQVPLGSVGALPVGLFALTTWWVCRSPSPRRRRTWMFGLLLLMVWPSAAAGLAVPTQQDGSSLVRGARLWTFGREPTFWARSAMSAPLIVISSEVDVGRLLAALRANRIAAIDVLVVVNGGRSQSSNVRAVASRLSLGAVVVADPAMAGGVARTVRVTRPLQTRMGDLAVSIRPVGAGKLAVAVDRLTNATESSDDAIASLSAKLPPGIFAVDVFRCRAPSA